MRFGRSWWAAAGVAVFFAAGTFSALGTASTDPLGQFSKSVAIPANAYPGTNQIKVKADTLLTASEQFTVT